MTSGSPVAQSGPGLVVTYLANEGFLLEAGGTEVLVDGAFGAGLDPYARLPEAMREDLERGRGAFTEVDLVLVTHVHRDHFDPVVAGRHLASNPRAVLVGTGQAADSLARHFEDWPAVRERVRRATPAAGRRLRLEAGGLALEALGIPHPTSRNQPVEHAAWLFELGGLRILHLGDAGVDGRLLAELELPAERIDVAFVPYWLLVDENDRAALLAGIHPARIVAMHVPPGEVETVGRRLGGLDPPVTVCQEPGDSLRFP